MNEESNQKKDFATTGTDSFRIEGQEKPKGGVVLNIQEDKPSGGVFLPKTRGEDFVSSGIFFVDLYKKLNFYLLSRSGIKAKDKATFFHLLSVMINAGVPMVRALKSLELQMEKTPNLQLIIKNLSIEIEEGNSLSEAMLKHPKIFDESEIGMVQSGEASGQLSRVLDNLSKDAEKAYQIKSKVKSAMTYPIVIFLLLIAVIVGMMVFVIPRLTDLFETVEGELPLLTRVVVGLSDFITNNGVLLLLLVVGFVAFIYFFKKTYGGRVFFDTLKLKIPIFGRLFQMAYLSKFARSLSNLTDSNVSIVRTLEITANSIGNEVYRKKLLLSVEDIKQGIPLAENLSATDLFPPMLVNMIDVGEKTAQLDAITGKIATFYENEVDTAVAGISKIIEPVILIIIGLTVGAVVGAIMMPIMQLSDLTSAL
jgi:type IV pilus assembly protein PilC